MRTIIIQTLILFAFLPFMPLQAQSYQPTQMGARATIGTNTIELEFFSPDIVRIVKYPATDSFKKNSLSVVKQPENTKFTVWRQANELVLKSSQLTVRVNLDNATLSFYDKNTLLLTEQVGGVSFVDFDDAGSKTYTAKQVFTLDKDEHIYGLGQMQRGKMSQRNLNVKMIQDNIDDYVPFIQSNKGWGLFWDNYSPTTFHDDETQTFFESEVADGIDYYFMVGGSADGVIACMRELTGHAPMFPLWTYGFWQSRERYKTQDELLEVVRNFRERGVPLDGIIQDWQYWGNNYQWNAMDFVNPGFRNPEKMVEDVHKMNAHIIISIWNSFGPKTKQYKELDAIGALFNFETWPQSGYDGWPPRMDYPSGVRVYDPFNPKARDIYWRYLKEGLFSKNIDGWWIDSSEPDHFNPKEEDFDQQTYLGSFRKVRNAFPLMTVGGVYDNQRAVTSDKRVFILTRSAFAGQQRYGANLWSGDVVASWKALRNQISAGLNVSMAGIPHWNSDIGGFFLWDYRNPLQNPDYRELHVRWMQFGAFCPMMRSHGEGYPREIYQFGEKGNPVYDAIEKAIQLRYSLLPYIYSTSWEVTNNHSSMMRALVMDFASDNDALDIDNQYMFGKSILVCPVTEAQYLKNDEQVVADFSSVKKSEVYLPRGTSWYDYWTGEQHEGGQTISKETPLDIIPLFVKAGSILPVGPEVQYATEKPWDMLEIRIYRGADGVFVLYEDENDNYNYEKGMYSTIRFRWNERQRSLTIEDRQGTFPGMLDNRKFKLVFVDEQKGIGIEHTLTPDRTISYTGKRQTVRYR
jgi:alpha-D-xyloside xylohydrolase